MIILHITEIKFGFILCRNAKECSSSEEWSVRGMVCQRNGLSLLLSLVTPEKKTPDIREIVKAMQ